MLLFTIKGIYNATVYLELIGSFVYFLSEKSTDISTTSEEITERYFSINFILFFKIAAQLNFPIVKFTVLSSLEQEQLKEPEKQLNPQVEVDSASSVNISPFIIEQIIVSMIFYSKN